MSLKLNVGDGGVVLDGYTPIDIKRGEDATALPYEDGSVDEVRASHILEHFPHEQAQAVVREWVRVLKPGGVLKVAVPDFRILAEQYLAGSPLPIQGYVMGGQIDADDFHKAIYGDRELRLLLRTAGLVAIRRWNGEGVDCASLPLSLNLCGMKPQTAIPKVSAILSVPRLGFNDFWACAYRELAPLGIPLTKSTGAYWDNSLTGGIEEALKSDPEWILTCDYDTVFNRDQVLSLIDVASKRPHIDALAPLQTARHHDQPMFTVKDAEGQSITKIKREDLEGGEVIRAETAHFGLTLLRASKLHALPKPWFNRTYGETPRDPDVQFWHNWKAAGNSLYVALRVPVGHCELMVRWPDINLEATFQLPGEFHKSGPPENIWR